MSHEIDLLQARLGQLEKQVSFLLRLNGLDLSALRSEPNEKLLRFYQDAVQLLGLLPAQLPPEVIERWAEFFLQLSEFEMVRLQGIINYNHTWEPFYYLAIKLMTSVRQHPDMGKNTGLHHLYAMLEKGRRNLRDIAVIMCRRHPEDLPQKAKVILQDGELNLK